MVVWSKIVPIAALGVGILFLANAFTRPAAATSTARALTEQVSVLGAAGSSIQQLGRGVGGGLAGLFQPIWEVSNLIERFSSLSSGSANVSPVSQDLGGYASYPTSPTYTTSSGTDSPTPTSSPTSTISWSSGQTATVPSLSSAARSYYSKLGVSVS
jgi:hypothetical protein